MANPFDQFDGQTAAPTSAASNPFDSFDQPSPQPANAPGVLTDDGTVWPEDQPPGTAPAPAQPGLLSRIGGAIAHPMQTAEDAWNYPGSYLADAVRGQGAAMKSAVTLPGDVATGKVDMNDPSQAGSNTARVLSAALMESPARASSMNGAAAKLGAPSTGALYTAGRQGFDDWRNSGLEYDPQDAAAWATQFQQGLNKNGILPVAAGAPSTHSILDSIANPPPNALPMSAGDLDSIRKSFVNTAQGAGANNTERMAANDAKSGFLDYLQNASPINAPPAPLAGPAAAAPSSAAVGNLRDAIGNWASASRGDLLDNIGSNAELRDEVSHSGHGGGNPLRQSLAAALRLNPSTGKNLLGRSGFNDAEQDAVSNAVGGGPVRTASNLAGGGLGHAGLLGGLLAAREGYDAGGIPGAIAGGSLPFVGSALRGLDQSSVASKLADASNMVRSRSPLAQSGAVGSVTPNLPPTMASRLARAMMAQQGGQGQQQPTGVPLAP